MESYKVMQNKTEKHNEEIGHFRIIRKKILPKWLIVK